MGKYYEAVANNNNGQADLVVNELNDEVVFRISRSTAQGDVWVRLQKGKKLGFVWQIWSVFVGFHV
jgi:hypothetical protein